jgi:hypothetical protein
MSVAVFQKADKDDEDQQEFNNWSLFQPCSKGDVAPKIGARTTYFRGGTKE